MPRMPKTILIVDDEKNVRFSISVALRMSGYRVVEAANGIEALDLIRASRQKGDEIALLLLDIKMPLMNGLVLLDRLHEENLCIPVLISTGYGDREITEELVRRGCGDFMEKPFEPSDMIAKVNGILGRTRQ